MNHAAKPVERSRLIHVHGLALGKTFFDVKKYNNFSEFHADHGFCTGCAYVSGAYNGNFHRFAVLKKRAAKRLLKGII